MYPTKSSFGNADERTTYKHVNIVIRIKQTMSWVCIPKLRDYTMCTYQNDMILHIYCAYQNDMILHRILCACQKDTSLSIHVLALNRHVKFLLTLNISITNPSICSTTFLNVLNHTLNMYL